MDVNGSCHCGDLTFTATVSKEAMVCHCDDCQVLSGSAFRINLKAPAASFTLLSGDLGIYRKVADSGNVRLQTFCKHCATPIYSSPEENAENLFLRIGVIKERKEIIAATQIWQRSALSNFLDLSDVKGSMEQQAL